MVLSFLLIIILFFFCAYFYLENQKLKQRIIKLELETKEILERKIMKNTKEDLRSMSDISIEINYNQSTKNKQANVSKVTVQENIISNGQKQPIKKYIAKNNGEDLSLNVSNPTTPNLTNYNNKSYSYKNDNMNKEKEFDPNEFIQKETRAISNIRNQSPIQPTNNNSTEYLREISNQIAAQLEPKTIELTEYEKNEEEQAIISYQELLSLKDKVKFNDESNVNFIDNINDFRNLLD